MSYAPDRVLVTGGAGFIGSAFVRKLLPDASCVVTLDRMSTGSDRRNLEGLPGKHRFVRGDISDYRLVTDILRGEAIDTIVHFAAESHVDRSIADPMAFFESNVTGTLRLLQAATACWIDEPGAPATRNASREQSVRFHHVSTDEVYGSLGPGDPAFTETSSYAPRSPYAASKAASDHLVRSWRETYGLPVTISNCSNNYGARQHREKLIPTVIRCCIQGTRIPVYGDGTNRRDWLHVEDHCDGIARIIADGKIGQTYNLGSGIECSNNELVRQVCETLDELQPATQSYAALVEYVDDRPGHDWRYAMDCSKAIAELGWSPAIGLQEGITQTCAWYLEHRDRLGG